MDTHTSVYHIKYAPAIETWREAKKETDGDRHEERADDSDDSAERQAPLRLHHLNLA